MNDVHMHIRRGSVVDAPALAAFAAHTFADAFGADNRPEDMHAHLQSAYGIAQQTRELEDPAVTTLLVDAGEALVGYAQIRRKAPPACVIVEHAIELHRFYVDRPAHGRGIAQRLMAAAQDAARAFAGSHLWLSVWERNARALAFYRKAGFVDVGSADFFVGRDRQSDRVMVARIPVATDAGS